MCSFQPREGETFNYTNFESHWCSHIIIVAADILIVGGVTLGPTVVDNIEAFRKWNVKNKPLLVLSIGDMQEKEIWRVALQHPMRRTVTVRNDPKTTIEEVSYDWVCRGVPSSKLIVGFSAEGLTMFFQNVRANNEIGAPANVMRNKQIQKAENAGAMSQADICKILQDNQTRSFFIEELGIPYATRNDEFIAYDNVRSMQVKAIWASLNNFGGIGLHAIGMDNIYGECPQGQPYPLLKALIKAQVCDYCIHDASKKLNKNPKHNKCEPDFQVACSYILPKGEKSLNPEQIPLGQCTEIV
uniref:GH18 domain-containing protein n=1 Tax=Panagrolaimus sp. PS1159 TaxID=55785 RepID=A0AC35G5M4_9BILA